MRSMTGYASEEAHIGPDRITIEVKTLNNRYLELKFRSSPEYSFLEPKILKELKSFFSRGSIEMSLFRETRLDKTSFPSLNTPLISYYFKTLRHLKKKFLLKGDIHVRHLISMPNIWNYKHSFSRELEFKKLFPILQTCFKKVNLMREKEGNALQKMILRDIKRLEKKIIGLSFYKETLSQKHEERLKERMTKLLGEQKLDDQRLCQEIAYLMDKADVGEELQRLSSHLKHFRSVLHEKGAIGKKLDFVIQEMNREINTVGSKIQDLKLTQEVIECKSLLEKMREQVQNVE